MNMSAGLSTFSNPGDSDQKSPSVWAGCPNTLLNDRGLGQYVFKDFIGDDTTLPGTATAATGTATYTYNDGSQGFHTLNLATGATDNNSAVLVLRPASPIQRLTSAKLWFEARIAPAALTDQAIFAGFGELAALAATILANDPSNSAQAGLIGESVIGFVSRQVASATTKIDLVTRNAAGTVRTVLADVTNATGLPLELRSDLVANEFRKYGLVVNPGLKQIQAFVDGYQVAAIDIDSELDQVNSYGAAVAILAGSAGAKTARVDFVGFAGQVRT
jgi:hypothetical protein